MDPYQILEVSPNATKEEIRNSYRRLVKKYHPDRYPEGPQRDFATEKIKKINAAYDMIQNGGGTTTTQSGGNSGADFARVRQLIQANNLTAAAHILDGMTVRNAQWYYLYGVIHLRRGWYDNARSCFERAYQMDPGNSEYANAYRNTQQTGQPYSYTNTTHQTTGTNSGCCSCDLCTTLLCMDCCCECMGGDLFRCC